LTEEKKKKATKKALEHLATASEMRPNWVRPTLLAAALNDDQGDGRSAVDGYIRTIELGVRDPAVIRRVIQLLYGRQDYATAGKLLQRFEQEQRPFSTDLYRLQSQVSAKLEDFDGALAAAKEVTVDSQNYQDHIWLGQVLGIVGQRTGGTSPDPATNAMLVDAEKSLRRAVELAGDLPETWVALVQFLTRTDQIPAAETATEEARGKIAADKLPLAMGECLRMIGKTEDAEKEYQKALAKAPKDLSVIRQVAEFCSRNGGPQLAEPQLKQIVAKKLPADEKDLIWARRVLALVMRGRGDFPSLTEALDLVEENLKADKSSALDKRTKAVLLFGHPEKEQRQEGIQILKTLVEQGSSPSPDERYQLAQVYLRSGEWAEARKQMVLLLANHEGHGDYNEYLRTFIRGQLQNKEISEAELWLRRLEAVAPDAFSTTVLKAEALFLQGKPDQVVDLLTSAVAKPDAASPPDVRRLLSAARGLESFADRSRAAGDEAAATRFVTEAEKLMRQYAQQLPAKKLALAAFLARQDQLDEALDLLEDAWEDADPDDVGGTITGVLSKLDSDPEHAQRIEKVLLAALQKHDRPFALLYVLSQSRIRQERFDDAEAIYRELLQKDSKNVVVMNDLAELLAFRRQQPEEALELVQTAIKMSGPVSNLLDTRASVYLALDKPREAIQDARDAIAENPRPNRHFHLARAYYQAKQKEKAAEALQEAEKLGLDPQQLHPLERPVFRKLKIALN